MAQKIAAAESDLRHELTFQHYSQAQIDSAVTTLKNMAKQNRMSVPISAKGDIGLGSNVTLSLPSDSDSKAVLSGSNLVTYQNTSVATDTTAQAIDSNTIETQHIIRSKDAPEQFIYKLNNLPKGALLRQTNAQTVEAYAPNVYSNGGKTASEIVLGTFKAPWARDALGRSVPISLTAGNDNTLVLNVSHRSGNYLYPIVADPWARWGWNGFMWWGSNYEIDHFSYQVGLAGIFLGIFDDPAIAAAITGIIVGVAGVCKGPHGATFYFLIEPWLPMPFLVHFAGCEGW